MTAHAHCHHRLFWLLAAAIVVLAALLVPAQAHGVSTPLGPLPNGVRIAGDPSALSALRWDFDCNGAFSVVVLGAAPGTLSASVTLSGARNHPRTRLWARGSLALAAAGDYRLKLSQPRHEARMAYVDRPKGAVVTAKVTYASSSGNTRVTFPVPARALQDVRSDTAWHGSGQARAHPSVP